jgi:MFS transporter, PAT family, beta-lactamase induction signal transducer AmpG
MPAGRTRSMGAVLQALRRPKVALMLVLGFSSGLPFMLIGNTLGFWLAEDGIKLAVIGFLSWITLTYSVKFLWGAVVDRLPAPLVGRLGRRRGWMIITQVGVGVGLVGMSLSDPRTHLAVLIGFGLLTGVSAAAQDTVVDAWRIESADDKDELGLLTAAYSLGYRGALIATEALILLVAQALSWPMAYGIYGVLMAVGLIAALLIKEPARADEVMARKARGAARHPLRTLLDAVIGPFIEFFRAHGLVLAALMLAMITTYHLCDYMRGPMINPYYKALGLDKATIAGVRLAVGLPASLLGITLGGISALRLGNFRTLIVGALLQPLAVAAFAFLGWHGGDYALFALGPVKVTAFEVIMAFDGVTMAYAGVGLVSYMSTLTSLGYTATQYALLTSALTWTGKTLKGLSGVIVDELQHGRTLLQAYAIFSLLCGAIGLPAIVLCLFLARPRAATALDLGPSPTINESA